MPNPLAEYLKLSRSHSELIQNQIKLYDAETLFYLNRSEQGSVARVRSKLKISLFHLIKLPIYIFYQAIALVKNIFFLKHLRDIQKFLSTAKNITVFVVNSKRGNLFDDLPTLKLENKILEIADLQRNLSDTHTRILVIDIANHFRLSDHHISEESDTCAVNLLSILFLSVLHPGLFFKHLYLFFITQKNMRFSLEHAFLLSGIMKFFASVNVNNVFLLTSNSRSVEAIRAYFLCFNSIHPRKLVLTECLHGVIDASVTKYFKSLSERTGDFISMRLIDCIPQLHGRLDLKGFTFSTSFINSAWTANSQPLLNPQSNTISRKTVSALNPKGLPVIILYGCVNIDTNFPAYKNSRVHLFEGYVLEKIYENIKLLDQETIIFYCPHPQHREEFSSHQIFNSNTLILNNSLHGFLMADFAIGICSATIFEAHFFGAHSLLLLNKNNTAYDSTLTQGIGLVDGLELSDVANAIAGKMKSIFLPIEKESFSKKVTKRVGILSNYI